MNTKNKSRICKKELKKTKNKQNIFEKNLGSQLRKAIIDKMCIRF